MLHSAFLQTHPERTSQDTPSKPQTLRFHLTYPCLEFCLNTSRCHIAHFGKPILNQRTPRYTIKASDPKILPHMFDLCQNSSPYYTAHFCKHILNQHPKYKIHLTPQDFILRVPILEFAGTTPQIAPRMSANPSKTGRTRFGWTYV
jgi:hypothetical protein